MNLQKTTLLLRAVANIKRLEILFYLRHSESSVGALEKQLGLSQSALSQHLAVLRKAQIVQTRRHKQQIFYRLENKKIKRLLTFLSKD